MSESAEISLPAPLPPKESLPPQEKILSIETINQQALWLQNKSPQKEGEKITLDKDLLKTIAEKEIPKQHSQQINDASFNERSEYWGDDPEAMTKWQNGVNEFLNFYKDDPAKTTEQLFLKKILGQDDLSDINAANIYKSFIDKDGEGKGSVEFFARKIVATNSAEDIEQNIDIIKKLAVIYGEKSANIAEILTYGIKNWQTNPEQATKLAQEKLDQQDTGDITLWTFLGQNSASGASIREAAENKPATQPSEPKQDSESEKAEPIEWKNVKRTTEVMAVGDLFGSTEALLANLDKLGVIKVDDQGKLIWTGGNNKIVFHGDILGDRQPHGLDVIKTINDLSKQAESQGGTIDVISGNHEDFFLSFLSGRDSAGASDSFESCRQGGYIGLLELCKYGSDSIKNINLDNFFQLTSNQRETIWQQLKKERKQILQNMRQDPEGREILETLCKLKLVVKHDDSLFIHTDPTSSIIQALTARDDIDTTVNGINKNYQEGLRLSLLEDNEPPDAKFDILRDTFLDTNNRDYFWDQMSQEDADKFIDRIKKLGINAIFHGHSDTILPFSDKNGLLVSSIDMSALKNNRSMGERSVLKIRKDGIAERGASLEQIRK